MLKLFKVSCPSRCGSYFGTYLQHVMVKASDADEALNVIIEWMKETGNRFIYLDHDSAVFRSDFAMRSNWSIEELCELDNTPCVVDYHEDSDY